MENTRLESFKFPKEERLHHRSLVEGLFREGKSFYEFPFRVTWRKLSDEEFHKNFRDNPPEAIGNVQVLITVPKKKRRKAVDRVLIRRRIREAYRLNRIPLRSAFEDIKGLRHLAIALVYIHDKNLDYRYLEEKIKIIIGKLQSKIPGLSNCQASKS